MWPPHPRPLSPVSRGRGEFFVFRFQASRGRKSAGEAAAELHRRAGLAFGFVHGVCGPLTPDPSPRFTWARGHLVFSFQASRGRKSAGEAAVELHCRAGLAFGCVHGVCGRLTPDPSPPFHGCEGGISFQLSNGVRAGKGEMLRNVTCLF